jgi:hypothetical protein
MVSGLTNASIGRPAATVPQRGNDRGNSLRISRDLPEQTGRNPARNGLTWSRGKSQLTFLSLRRDVIIGRKTVFALRVRGDSMQEEHIADGITCCWREPRKRITETSWLRWSRDTTQPPEAFLIFRARPSGCNLRTLLRRRLSLTAASVQIQGKVIGVLRKY